MRSQLIGFLGGAVLCARIASAATLTVNAGGNLQAALNAANGSVANFNWFKVRKGRAGL